MRGHSDPRFREPVESFLNGDLNVAEFTHAYRATVDQVTEARPLRGAEVEVFYELQAWAAVPEHERTSSVERLRDLSRTLLDDVLAPDPEAIPTDDAPPWDVRTIAFGIVLLAAAPLISAYAWRWGVPTLYLLGFYVVVAIALRAVPRIGRRLSDFWVAGCLLYVAWFSYTLVMFFREFGVE